MPLSGVPGVSILRPVKGTESAFVSCMKSTFEQDYPNFEIIFCIKDANDPAVPVLEELCSQYKNVPTRILTGQAASYGQKGYGPNPKINNLAQGFDQAQHDILWVIDSNAWVDPGTLGRAVNKFRGSVGLVHHLPVAVSFSGWIGSRLDEMYLSTGHAKFYTGINAVGVAPCVMGKSNLFRKSSLLAASPDGFRYFSHFISEDQMLSETLWEHGERTCLVSDLVIQPTKDETFIEYWFRRLRWIRIRKYVVTGATLVEPFTESIVSGIYGGWAISALTGISAWSYFWLHMSLWCLLDYAVYHSIRARAIHEIKTYYDSPATINTMKFARWLYIWLAREVLALPIWIAAMCGSSIVWRGQRFRINADNSAEPVSKLEPLSF
ncbi:glycosyltransferase family 21 protein [Tortispora caseinolytica NRRL Y-17796]|uniref:Ceramide glucosyltransferase n=1 Tax=Tortispora caseinolytica NRRL Y-17796 TaxID=767744 RepID=A0A1E4TIT9_9ASCO|nr:glycosyltransferase family 21 protein [Tortispora caseinolytica NRRL Y-17796]